MIHSVVLVPTTPRSPHHKYRGHVNRNVTRREESAEPIGVAPCLTNGIADRPAQFAVLKQPVAVRRFTLDREHTGWPDRDVIDVAESGERHPVKDHPSERAHALGAKQPGGQLLARDAEPRVMRTAHELDVQYALAATPMTVPPTATPPTNGGMTPVEVIQTQ